MTWAPRVRWGQRTDHNCQAACLRRSWRVVPRGATAERRSMNYPAAAVAVVAAAPSRLVGTPARRGTGSGGSSTAVPGTRGARKNGAH
jgi:hypothetical protein